MTKFCEICHNIVIFNDDALYVCTFCKDSTPLTPEDTLLTYNRKLPEESQFTTCMYGAPKDPTTKKHNEKCDKCNVYKTEVHLGVEEKTLLLCLCIYKK